MAILSSIKVQYVFHGEKINHNPTIFINLSFSSLSAKNVGSTSGLVHQEYAKASRNIKQTTCICSIVPFTSRKKCLLYIQNSFIGVRLYCYVPMINTKFKNRFHESKHICTCTKLSTEVNILVYIYILHSLLNEQRKFW